MFFLSLKVFTRKNEQKQQQQLYRVSSKVYSDAAKQEVRTYLDIGLTDQHETWE